MNGRTTPGRSVSRRREPGLKDATILRRPFPRPPPAKWVEEDPILKNSVPVIIRVRKQRNVLCYMSTNSFKMILFSSIQKTPR